MHPDALLWSRRYICVCGFKGRVSPARRGPVVTCEGCGKPTPSRPIADTLALNAARHGVKTKVTVPPAV